MKFKISYLIICVIFGISFSCGSSDTTEEEKQETAYLDVSPRKMTIDSDGGTLYATLSSNRDVNVLPSKSWCRAEIISGKTTDNLKITIDVNKDAERTAGLLLSAKDCPSIELTITQRTPATDPGGGEEDPNAVKFKLASYNIRYASAADVETGNGWDVRKTPLANLILTHDFDIVGTQEGNSSQLSDLKNLLSGYDYVAYPYGGSNNKLHNCATFYKKAKFEVLDQGVFWLSETPNVESIGWDATDTRICNWTKFKEKSKGKEFYIFNTHFYYQYTTARQNSGKLLIDKIKAISSTTPSVSTGDFNSTPSTSQISTILTYLKDAYDMTETTRVGPDGTGFPGGVFQGTPGSRIDYIFVTSHFRVLDYAVLVDSYNNGRYPSDHLPVTSMLSLRND